MTNLDQPVRDLLFAIARGEHPVGDRLPLYRDALINSADQITGRGLVALTMNGWVGPLPVAGRPDRPIMGDRWADKRAGS